MRARLAIRPAPRLRAKHRDRGDRPGSLATALAQRWALAFALACVVSATTSAAPASASFGVLAWGSNSLGQLGIGETGAGTDKDEPWTVKGPAEEAVQVAAGGNHSLALLKGGTVLAWGADETGQLGNGEEGKGKEKDEPVAVTVKNAKGEPEDLKEVIAVSASSIVSIAIHEGHSLALLKNNTVVAWGANLAGQLGDGEEGSGKEKDEPVAVTVKNSKGEREDLKEVIAIAAGEADSLALLKNGTVMAWGWNKYGQLGDGAGGEGDEKDEPVLVAGPNPEPEDLRGVVAIAAGDSFNLALLETGIVVAWGLNTSGELGDGTVTGPEKCGSFSCSVKPVGVKGLTKVKAVAAGGYFGLALLEGGTAMAWGDNSEGELGNGEKGGDKDEPVAVKVLEKGLAVSAGGRHALAVAKDPAKDDELLAWGENTNGELGDGEEGTARDEPAIVKNLVAVSIPLAVAGSFDNLAFGLLATPLVETGSAEVKTKIGKPTSAEAELKGKVDAEGSKAKYHFEYGLTSSFGMTTAEASAGSSTLKLEESQTITGLAMESTYHYRMVASNAGGTSYGAEKTFTTPGCGHEEECIK